MINEIIKSRSSSIALIILSGIALAPDSLKLTQWGLPFIIIGMVIYLLGREHLGSEWSVTIKISDNLVSEGLFNHVRHPMYLGLMILCAGLALSTMSLPFTLLFALAILPYLYCRARLEENLLKKTLKGYAEYMSNTWMFLPKIL